MRISNSSLPDKVDHILYASATLEQGIDEIERLLGVRPAPGGHHHQYGTHNALLSLGPGIYLEVIARDPKLAEPERGALVDIAGDQRSRLITWVLRAEHIEIDEELSAIGIGSIQAGNRKKPDGSTLSWRLTDPYAMPMGGAIPFLISWGDSSHPATVVPFGGELVQLGIEHPEPERVQESLSVLGADVQVIRATDFRIVARIRTKDGIKILD